MQQITTTPTTASDSTSTARSTPFSTKLIEISQEELVELKWAAGYYQTAFERAQKKCQELKQHMEKLRASHRAELKALKSTYDAEIAQLNAKCRLREQQLFGKKSETSSTTKSESASSNSEANNRNKRPRGQQKGAPGHGRNSHADLPVKTEVIALEEEQARCPCCLLPYTEFPTTEDSTILEIEVRAHKRCIQRKRYKKACQCAESPNLITAPKAARLIPKGLFGVSIWVAIILGKFSYYYPIARRIREYADKGLKLSQGTITDGLKKIKPVFGDLYADIKARNQTLKHWHADETRWSVYEEIEGKQGYRWYLWVYRAAESVVFELDPSRSSAVPKTYFKNSKGVLNVDRYAAYKSMAAICNIELAYCWAHVRRDFLTLAKQYPEHDGWAMEWISAIGELYHVNKERWQVLENKQRFLKADRKVRDAVSVMEQQVKTQLAACEDKVHPVCKKVLVSLDNHWQGLTIFVDHPEIPMDNNPAENSLRGPVVLRKNARGSGSQWSGELTAELLTILETLKCWHINVDRWLTEYLQACADNGGNVPADWQSFLPWNMTEARLIHFGGVRPASPKVNDTS